MAPGEQVAAVAALFFLGGSLVVSARAVEDSVCALQTGLRGPSEEGHEELLAPPAAATQPGLPGPPRNSGDPHVSNLQGQKFDIMTPGRHVFLVVPRGSDEDRALLHVQAGIEAVGPVCEGFLYITSVVFSGQWLGELQRLELSTTVDAGMDPQAALLAKIGSSEDGHASYQNISALQASLPTALGTLELLHPARPPELLMEHVTTMVLKLQLGFTTSMVRMVHQRERSRFTNSLWLSAAGLQHAMEEVGGILGLDDHAPVARRPTQCTSEGSPRRWQRRGRGTVHAEAIFGDRQEDSGGSDNHAEE